jgi:hypothetical protein
MKETPIQNMVASDKDSCILGLNVKAHLFTLAKFATKKGCKIPKTTTLALLDLPSLGDINNQS